MLAGKPYGREVLYVQADIRHGGFDSHLMSESDSSQFAMAT
jgi:hypothetical protein